MKDFYVYLPSNTDCLHKNKASQYVTKLAKELTLGSDWKCCLKEIHYPRYWNTLDRDEGNFYIHHLNQNTWETKTLPPGHYESTKQVIDAMNKVLSGHIGVSYHLTNCSVQHTVRIGIGLFRAINSWGSHTLQNTVEVLGNMGNII